jgi:TetR/AcrR family transcriptional repressor of bet genes
VRQAFRAIVDGVARRLRAILADGVRSGAFACRPAETAAAILAAIEGSFVLAAAAPGTIPTGSTARCVKRMAAALVHAG